MKLVIMAGGFGTRLGDISQYIPKPMVEIGGKPILWHIMKIYSYYGINDFIICLGYKANVIKDYFVHYQLRNQDFTINLKTNSITFHNQHDESDWNVTLVDTGLNTLKGGRLKRVERYLEDETNLLTYGDGVADVNIEKLIQFHKQKSRIITITGVHPPARFGELVVNNGELHSFEEKAQTSQGLINGGFMVFEKILLDYLTTDESCDLEKGVFEKLAKEQKISVYMHEGNWACVDHERDLNYLNSLWNMNQAFWRKW